jgi:hypothetical protein
MLTFYTMLISEERELIDLREEKGDGSSAQNSSARKNCSTPKSRLLTPFKQMNKNMKLLKSTFSNGLTRFEQMSIILLSARNVKQ